MTNELKEFIEICDCSGIQDSIIEDNPYDNRLWCVKCNEFVVGSHYVQKYGVHQFIYFPTIDQLLEIIGDRFATLKLLSDHWMASYWTGNDKHTNTTKRVNGQSARISLAKAAKQILTERSGG